MKHMRGGWRVALGVLALMVVVFWHDQSALGADGGTRGTSRARKSSTSAEADETDMKRLEKKLAEVLANQQTILQKFDEIMEELRIIKVRASIRSGAVQ